MSRTTSLACLAASLLVFGSRPLAASPITAARWFSPSEGQLGEQFTTNGSTSIDLAAVDIFSDFGLNRVRVTTIESSGYSAWFDEWTVTGGTGSGLLEVGWTVKGTLTATEPFFCPSCGSSSIVFSSLFGAASSLFGTPIFSASQTGTGTTNVNQTGTLLVPFTYGTQFHAGFGLNGSVDDDLLSGSVNFFNSATVTAVVLPSGASLMSTNSRIQFPVQTATPVPEPSTLLLFGTGLVAAFQGRRPIGRRFRRPD